MRYIHGNVRIQNSQCGITTHTQYMYIREWEEVSGDHRKSLGLGGGWGLFPGS